jgi:hypothetical protein
METIFTAACLLHRYALIVSDIDSDTDFRWKIMCLIFISCKSLEEHRRLRDLINLASMLEKAEDDDSKKTIDSVICLTWKPTPPNLDEEYWKSKEYIVKAEQAVLRKLGFDLHVSQPHRLVVMLVQDCFPDVASNVHKKWVEDTWALLNSCIFSVLALQQPTLTLAVSALDMTISQNKRDSEQVPPTDWWKDTGVSPNEMQRVSGILQTIQRVQNT